MSNVYHINQARNKRRKKRIAWDYICLGLLTFIVIENVLLIMILGK